jgi:hypothetical protein
MAISHGFRRTRDFNFDSAAETTSNMSHDLCLLAVKI